MGRRGQKGSITVFLSLVCILFLSLICASAESARVQGAKAQSANITGMGNFSLLAEFDRELLEKYNIFSLDGTYGSGTFQISKVNERLQHYISYNADPRKGVFSPLAFDPWKLSLTGSDVSEYALLTDQSGEPFYQQAVSYMKENAAVLAADKLLEYAKNKEQIETWQKNYEESRKNSDSQMAEMESKKEEKIKELESEAKESGADGSVMVPEEPQSNPLKEIWKLQKKSTLSIVTWDKTISDKSIKTGGLPSKSRSRRGNMRVEKKHSGLLCDVLFREYLLMHFPNFLSKTEGKALDYQVEYIMGGKTTDEKNLKYVVNRLLLLREGMNYLYCLQSPQISAQAEGLALSMTGFLGIPALTAATKHALLLAWAYGESLVDVRILLDNGKVPLLKSGETWSLSIENLGRLTEILKEGAQGSGEGMAYDEYLRILLNMGFVSSQKMRALDMIQAELQQDYSEEFKVQNCIVAVKTDTYWDCPPVFFGLSGAVMGVSGAEVSFAQQGSIAY